MRFVGQYKWKDRPKFWTEDYSEPPDSFPLAKQKEYQEILNAVAGLSRDRPILLLEYGGNTRIKKYSKWGAISGAPLEEIEEPKYKLRRASQILEGVNYFYPIRRWIIAQRQEPEQYGYGDDSDNFFINEDGLKNKPSEKPKELYTPLIYVGDHYYCPPNCCEDKLCVGDYKDPGIPEIQWIAEKTNLLKRELIIDPYRKMSNWDLKKILSEVNQESNKKDEDLMEKIDINIEKIIQ